MTHSETLARRGVEALEQGRFDDAAHVFAALVARRPAEPALWHDLGLAHLRGHDLPAAIAALEQAVSLDPGYEMARLNLSRARLGAGDITGATEDVTQALARDPRSATARVLFAHLQEVAGEADAAARSYRIAARLAPHLAAPWCGLARIDRLEEGELAALESYLDQGSHERTDEASLRLAIAQAFDRRGEAARAFRHAARGNALRHTHYDPDLQARLVQSILASQPAELFAQPIGDRSETPVFILGMPRSGTSLVEQILAAHPEVHPLGERPDAGLLARDLASLTGARPFPAGVGDLDGESARTLAERYLRGVREPPPGASRVTDKAPANLQLAGLIARILPGARFVHCARDPRDVALSNFLTDFGDHRVGFASSLEHLAAHIAGFETLAAHWRSIPALRWHTVRYERLVADGEGELRELLTFLDLPWDPACLEFHRHERPCRTASSQQVRQPLHGRSVGRWRAYAPFLGPVLNLVQEPHSGERCA